MTLRRAKLLGLVAAGVLLSAGCSAGSEQAAGLGAAQAARSSGTGVLPVGQRPSAPVLVGDKVGGGQLDLATFRGQVLVLNTWGSWCAPCRAEARNLESVFQQTQRLGVQFVGINVRDNPAAAAAFQRTYALTYPSLQDRDGTLSAQFRDLPPSAIPSTLVIDRTGRTAARFIGALTEQDLLPIVRQVAHEGGPEPRSSPS